MSGGGDDPHEDSLFGSGTSADVPTMDVGSDRGSRRPGPSERSFGDYLLLEELARGGMGVVYKATQQPLGRLVAVKMILAGQRADAEEVERFRREARAVARLSHPNIVSIYEVGEHDGQPYLAMDYIEGETLAKAIRDQPLEVRQACELVRDVTAAVAYSHDKGTLHRDLKPGNILLDTSRKPYVSDFGLAKIIAGDEPGRQLTVTGQVIGTPGYMSPEQATADQGREGPASDVYSLGALLYATLTGRPPFAANSVADTLLQVIHTSPAPPRLLNANIPKDVENICLKCLEKDPAKRYHSARELADDLTRFLEGRPVLARPVGRLSKTWRWTRRNPGIAALAALSLLLLVGGTAVSSYFAVQAEARAEAEAEARRDAERSAYEAQWNAYVAQLQPMQQAWQEREYGHLERLIDKAVRGQGATDFRGWEWDFLLGQLGAVASPLSEQIPDSDFFIHDEPRNRLLVWTDDRFGIWDLQRQAMTGTLNPPSCKPETLSVSGDGQWVAFGDQHNQFCVWDIAADSQVAELIAPTPDDPEHRDHYAKGTHWSPGDDYLLTGSRSGALCLWNTDDWSLHRVLLEPAEENMLGGMAWHARSGLVTGHQGGQLRIWDVDEAKVTHTAKCTGRTLDYIKWSPTGERIAIAHDGLAIFTDQARRVGEHMKLGDLRAVAWIDEERVVCGGDGQQLFVCDAESAAVLETLSVHTGQIRSVAALSETRLVSGAVRDGIRSVSLAAEDVGMTSVRAHRGRATEVEYHPDGTQIATSGWDGKAVIWDAVTLEPLQYLQPHEHTRVCDVAWNAKGNRIATVDLSGFVHIWDPETGAELRWEEIPNLGHPRLQWQPSVDELLVGGVHPQIVDAATLQPLWISNDTYRSWQTELHVSPDGRRAMGNSQHGRVLVVDLKRRVPLKKFFTGDPGTGAGAWSPEGDVFVAAGADLAVYDTETYRRLATLRGHRGPVGGICFHPDGSRIASAGHDGSIRVWDRARGDCLIEIPISSESGLSAIGWSPDGSQLAVVDRRGELTLLTAESR